MSERTVVVDNSVVISWLFEDEVSTYADRILDLIPEIRLIVPAIWSLEVSNVLLVAEKRDRLNSEDAYRFINLLSQLPITVIAEEYRKSISRIFALGRANDLSAYDAAYLDLAIQYACPLASLDRKLIEAANRSGVPLFNG